MAKASGSIDLKDGKAASAVATNYVTDINNNNGITVHPANSTANRVQINSNGMEIFKDNDSVAFYGDTARIGKAEESHITINYRSLQLFDKDGYVHFKVSDLRDKNDNYNARITETFIADGEHNSFKVGFDSISEEVSATDSSHPSNTATRNGQVYSFATVPDAGATVTIIYKTTSHSAVGYTFGVRQYDSTTGGLSSGEGWQIVASGYASHAEGCYTTASGAHSHAEGYSTTASGASSHAEGQSTTASGPLSHAEGGSTSLNNTIYNVVSSGFASHAEGGGTVASDLGSHSEGVGTVASGFASHAEGVETIASEWGSHAQNIGTIAASPWGQTALGRYNIEDASGKYSVIIGNGDSETRSNALAIDWNGNVIAEGLVGEIRMHAKNISQTVIDGSAHTNGPNGWLLCDGSAISRTTYSALFDAIGTTYGAGDGSTTFNLPNFCGRTPIGVGESNATGHTAHTRGQMGGSEDAIIPYHKHDVAQVNITSSGGHTHTITTKYRANYLQSGTNRDSVNGGGTSTTTGIDTIAANTGTHTHSVPAHDTGYVGTSGNVTGANMMPYLGINFIIHVGIPTV